jgi:hypothetical protein
MAARYAELLARSGPSKPRPSWANAEAIEEVRSIKRAIRPHGLTPQDLGLL